MTLAEASSQLEFSTKVAHAVEPRSIVIICGCRRAGTTVVSQVLGAHPQALLVDEGEKCAHAMWELLAGAKTEALQPASVLESCRKYRSRDPRSHADWRLTASTTHLVFRAPDVITIPRREPDGSPVRRVVILRDVRDFVASMLRRLCIRSRQQEAALLNRLGEAELDATELAALRAADTPLHVRLALIWKAKYSALLGGSGDVSPRLVVRYEDLVRERRAQVERVLDFAGLPFSAECEHPETVFRGFGPGFVERSRPIDPLSLHRWSDRLSDEEEGEVWAVAREAMDRLGYERHPAPPPRRRSLPVELAAPVIAIGRGGSGTRLVSPMLEMMGVFLGNRRNASNDSLEWAELIYDMTLASCTDGDQKARWTPLLHERARHVLEQGKWRDRQQWGWKLPETMLVVREVMDAFPNARIVHLVRHPVDTCLRRTHQTSRLESLIGSAVLGAAYRACGRDERRLASDPIHIHNAVSWEYQVSRVTELGRGMLGPERYLEIRYEEMCRDPEATHAQIAGFIGADGSRPPPRELFDASGRARWSPPDSRADEVWQICCKTATRLGYAPPQPVSFETVADCSV